MIKIRNAGSVALGLLAATCFVFGYLNSPNQIDLFSVFLLCFSVLFILNGILEEQKTPIIYMIVGVLMLISLLIMVLFQNKSLSTWDLVVFSVIAILSLAVGIGVHVGFLPKRLLKNNL